VRLPDNRTADGFLGLYDDDIAIVTCLNLLDVRPIDLISEGTPATPVCPDDSLLASGRAFMSGSDTMYGPLMATVGEVKQSNKGSNLDCKGFRVSTCKIKKVLW
jgi:hypothetical protein